MDHADQLARAKEQARPYEEAGRAAGYAVDSSYGSAYGYAYSGRLKWWAGTVKAGDISVWATVEREGDATPGAGALALAHPMRDWLPAEEHARLSASVPAPADPTAMIDGAAVLFGRADAITTDARAIHARMIADGRALAAEIARQLGDGWAGCMAAADSDRREFEITLRRGAARLSFYYALNHRPADRYTIGGWFDGKLNQHRGYGRGHDEIGVSASKTAAQIAREVTRRLLPTYLDHLAKAEASLARTEAAAAGASAQADAIIEASGGALRRYVVSWRQQDETVAEVETVDSLAGASLHLEVYADRVNVKTGHLTPEQARQIARLLGAWRDRG